MVRSYLTGAVIAVVLCAWFVAATMVPPSHTLTQNIFEWDGSEGVVTGAGSVWEDNGNLIVGSFGNDTLTIEDGGSPLATARVSPRFTAKASYITSYLR